MTCNCPLPWVYKPHPIYNTQTLTLTVTLMAAYYKLYTLAQIGLGPKLVHCFFTCHLIKTYYQLEMVEYFNLQKKHTIPTQLYRWVGTICGAGWIGCRTNTNTNRNPNHNPINLNPNPVLGPALCLLFCRMPICLPS